MLNHNKPTRVTAVNVRERALQRVGVLTSHMRMQLTFNNGSSFVYHSLSLSYALHVSPPSVRIINPNTPVATPVPFVDHATVHVPLCSLVWGGGFVVSKSSPSGRALFHFDVCDPPVPRVRSSRIHTDTHVLYSPSDDGMPGLVDTDYESDWSSNSDSDSSVE
jgi:hypothetical protein